MVSRHGSLMVEFNELGLVPPRISTLMGEAFPCSLLLPYSLGGDVQAGVEGMRLWPAYTYAWQATAVRLGMDRRAKSSSSHPTPRDTTTKIAQESRWALPSANAHLN